MNRSEKASMIWVGLLEDVLLLLILWKWVAIGSGAIRSLLWYLYDLLMLR